MEEFRNETVIVEISGFIVAAKMAASEMAAAAADVTSGSYAGMSSDNIKGLVLALSSSFFIGASFIVKKKGLKKAGASGVRAGTVLRSMMVCSDCILGLVVENIEIHCGLGFNAL